MMMASGKRRKKKDNKEIRETNKNKRDTLHIRFHLTCFVVDVHGVYRHSNSNNQVGCAVIFVDFL